MKKAKPLFFIFLFIFPAVLAASLSPYALNGFWNDDSLNSSLIGELGRARISLLEFTWRITKDWLGSGRFFPLGLFQTYLTNYLIPDLRLFRMIHVFWVIVHIGLFAYLLHRLRVSWHMIGLWLLCLMGTFQVRNTNDPIASYGFFLQTQGILLTLALLSLLNWLESQKNIWLVLSTFSISVSLLMYELNYIFFPIAFGLLWFSDCPRQQKIKAFLAIIAPVIVFFIPLTLYLRLSKTGIYEGIRFSFNGAFFLTYKRQFLSAFPGNFYYYRWNKVLPLLEVFRQWISPLPIALSLMTGYLMLYLIPSVSKTSSSDKIGNLKNNKQLLVILLSLLCIPSALIAFSERYQKEVSSGNGYLPVYYSYFGVAFFIAYFLNSFSQKKPGLKWILAAAVALWISMNFIINNSVVASMDQVFFVPRASLEQALADDLFKDVTDGDIITINENLNEKPYFLTSGFLYQHSKKRIVLTGVQDISNSLYPLLPNKNPKYFSLKYDSSSDKGPKWILGSISPQ